MESFFRYISYVDYYRNEERVKNVGFLRWKLQNGRHQIEIQLKDVPCVQEKYEIEEKNTGKVLDIIEIDKGIGNCRRIFPAMTASGEEYIEVSNDRLYLKDVEGFLIQLNSNEFLSVPVKLRKEEKKFDIIKKDDIDLQDTKAASENVLIEGIEEKYTDPIYIKKVNKLSDINNKENSQESMPIEEVEYEKKENLVLEKKTNAEKKIKIGAKFL